MVVAVDGHSSTGKSTVAKLLAAELGYTYIDTGAMYRVVTLEAMRKGLIRGEELDREHLRECLKEINIGFKYNVAENRYETYLNGECIEDQIRGMEVSGHVSLIASVDFVREFLVKKQREMGKAGGVVMDGRDIGSVVFPDAEIKFFMTASPDVRAMRRYKELTEKGEKVSYQEVEENVRKRDYLDENREMSPLKQTADAIRIDNSNLSIEEEVRFMAGLVREKQ